MNPTALITGGSSGIGLSLARQFALHGHDLILVSEREDELDRAAATLRSEHSVSIHTIPQDLRKADGPRRVHDEVTASGTPIEVLVNDAGIGQHGTFAEIPLTKDLELIQ